MTTKVIVKLPAGQTKSARVDTLSSTSQVIASTTMQPDQEVEMWLHGEARLTVTEVDAPELEQVADDAGEATDEADEE